MKKAKRILSLLLVLTMVLSLFPMTLFASAEEGPAEFVPSETISVGDKLMLLAEFEGAYYAMTNDTATVSNALAGTAVPVTDGVPDPGAADVIWTVEAGSAEDTFVLRNKDGLAIAYSGSGTALTLAETGADLKITVGEGTSVLEYAGNAGRNIFFRMNNNLPQFRMYSTNNLQSAGYSSVLTLYKLPSSNIAPKAAASTATCASWNNVNGVNDGVVPAQSQGNQAGAYGSWGQNAACNPEYITLTWNTEVELEGAGMYFWHDNGKDNRTGIDFPLSYSFEYLAEDGETWTEVPNASGMAVDEDVVNKTAFDPILTTALRVVMVKESAEDNSYGLGVAEFEAYGWLMILDTAALEAAIAAAEAITNLANYTEASVAALTEALAAARAVLNAEAKTQAQIDEATEALLAAIAGLEINPVDRPAEPNIAPEGTASATYVASWNNVAGVNDGSIPASSNGTYNETYGSWGRNNNSNPEDITITFAEEAEITGAGLFFWADGGAFDQNGIDFPSSYTFEYLSDGAWVPVEGALGMDNKADVVNYTVFTPVTTTALRVMMNKSATGSFGLGVAEFEIYGSFGTQEEDLAGKTVILHTNDVHGAIMGYAQAAALKAEYEAKGADVLLVDAGDYSQGTIYVSTNKGAAAVEMMNAAGYDYATLGNHEFDFGYAQLKQNLEAAEFGVLCADVLLKADNSPAFTPNTIKEIGGLKIGFFGLETPETFTKVNPGLIQEISFLQGEELYACAQAQIDALRSEGADLVIGLVHLGVDAESEPNRSIDLYANVTGVDFLIDGHSHTVMTAGPNGEPIQSTGTKASETSLMNVGLIQIDNATKAIEKNELIPITEETPLDETVAAKAQAIMDEINASYNEVFAVSEVLLNGERAPGNRTEETNLGDLITDAMLWAVVKEGGLSVDDDHVVSITNGGGIRASIEAGDITMKMVNTVLPFGNTVAVVYVTGAELLEALEASTYCTPTSIGGFPQVSGIKFNIDVTKEFDQGEQYPDSTYYGPASIQRVTIDEINGKSFDPEAVYAVVTNNFCAAGGDTYYAFKAASSQFDTSLPMDEVLMDYIRTALNGVVGQDYAEPKGRITFEERTEPELPTYELVTDLASLNGNDRYVITVFRYFAGTNADSKNGYVLGGASNNCGGVRAPAADDYSTITAETPYADTSLWEIVPVEGGYTFRNVATGKYLGNVIPAASDEPVTLLVVTGAVNGVTNYGVGYDNSHYLRYSGSSDTFSWSSGSLSGAPTSTNACNVLFYKVVTGEEPPVPEPVQFFAGSDIQGANDWNQHLDNIARSAFEAGEDIDISFWCGDYADGSVYADGSDTSATQTPERIQFIKDTLANYWPDLSDYHFAQGNHDGSMHIGTVIDTTGPKEYEDFVLYQINEDDFPWWQAGYSTYSSEDTCLEKINATTETLGAYLDGLIAQEDQRVIFIYTHVPLHWTSRTTTMNSWWSDNIHADILFNMLNEKAESIDIVFLYGHNHSENYADAYPDGGSANFFAPGDTIRIPNGQVAASGNYTEETIKFTYLNAGYVGQVASGFVPNNSTASVISVWPDKVTFTRYTDTGKYEGSDRVLIRNNREEYPAYLQLNSLDNPVVRKEGDVEHFEAVLKNAEAASYTWTVEGNAEITEGQGTANVTVTYTGGETVVIKVTVTYTDSSGETQTLEQTKTVEVKAAPAQGEITYNEVKSIADLAEGKKYAVVVWRYFGGSDSDTFNGYGFGAGNTPAYRAPTDDNYETIKPEAELTDDQLWEIIPVDGGVTLRNLGTGKYLADAIPAASDEPYTLTIAEGECSGVYNMAIGTASGSIRYSGSSGTFVYSTTAPSGEVGRAWAANLTIYEKVEPPKVYPNIAPQGTASSDFCASWSSVAGVNDEVIPDSSNPGYDYNEAYGSWGKNSNSNPETILITFEQPAKLYGAGAFFWYNADGPHNQNGIDIPASYIWEYQNAAGEWVEFPNASGMGIEEDIMNQTTFDPVVAYVVRINMAKSTTGNYGLGVAELELYGEFVVPVDTSALEAAIAAAEAIEDPDIYTEESVAALNEALAAARAVMENVDKTQEEVDAAAEALNAAIAALVEKPLPNIAPEASGVEAPYCASWNNLAGVNDGVIPTASNTAGDNTAYGSWRSNGTADPEYITFTFEKPAEIHGASSYFLYNENSPHEQYGIDFPDAYTYEYLNAAGEWVEVPNASGYGLEEDILNQTTFDAIVTTAFRISMQRQAGAFGLGVGEIEIYGLFVTEYVDKAALAEAIAQAEALNEEDWTAESWTPLAEAMEAGKAVLADEEATQEEVDAATAAILEAIEALVDKVQVVIDMIDALPDPITLEDAEALNAARDAYDALTDEQKERVTNYLDLLLAEIAYYTLVSEEAMNQARQAAIETLTAYETHAAQDHDDEHVTAAEAALAEAIEAIRNAKNSEELQAAVEAGIAAINEALAGGELVHDCPCAAFTDMPKFGTVEHDAIDWAFTHEPQITNGTSDTTFGPEKTVTRGQAVTFLWRAAGEPTPANTEHSFTDVKESAYYYTAMLWAVEKGITNGTSADKFSPNRTCTKEQILTFIYRFQGEPEVQTTENPWTDVNGEGFGFKAIMWAVENGIAAPNSETEFGRRDDCTRAAIVTFLYRIMTGEGLVE